MQRNRLDPPMHVEYRCGGCGRQANTIRGRGILSWTLYLWECPHCGTFNDRPDAPDGAARAAAAGAADRERNAARITVNA